MPFTVDSAGNPISSNQGIQFPISSSYMNIEAAALMVQKSAALIDAGENPKEANIAKHLAAKVRGVTYVEF